METNFQLKQEKPDWFSNAWRWPLISFRNSFAPAAPHSPSSMTYSPYPTNINPTSPQENRKILCSKPERILF